MLTKEELKRRLIHAVDTLPDAAIEEVAAYLEYQEYRNNKRTLRTTDYRPVALGGLWTGITVDPEDIEDARKEMWSRFADDD